MTDFFEWLSNGSISAVVLIVAFSVVVIATVMIYTVAFLQGREISFYPPKIGEKPEHKRISLKDGNKSPYGISITNPAKEQVFYSDNEDCFIEVSGGYERKPESEKTLRFFTKTLNPTRYWYQSSIPDFSNGKWKGEVSIWKGKNSPGYSAVVIAVIVDEATENLIRYAEKVHRDTGKNIPFDNLPVYFEMCGEVVVKRE